MLHLSHLPGCYPTSTPLLVISKTPEKWGTSALEVQVVCQCFFCELHFPERQARWLELIRLVLGLHLARGGTLGAIVQLPLLLFKCIPRLYPPADGLTYLHTCGSAIPIIGGTGPAIPPRGCSAPLRIL
jgi:hypothetical protein